MTKIRGKRRGKKKEEKQGGKRRRKKKEEKEGRKRRRKKKEKIIIELFACVWRHVYEHYGTLANTVNTNSVILIFKSDERHSPGLIDSH